MEPKGPNVYFLDVLDNAGQRCQAAIWRDELGYMDFAVSAPGHVWKKLAWPPEAPPAPLTARHLRKLRRQLKKL